MFFTCLVHRLLSDAYAVDTVAQFLQSITDITAYADIIYSDPNRSWQWMNAEYSEEQEKDNATAPILTWLFPQQGSFSPDD
jgi:hypothetical protein